MQFKALFLAATGLLAIAAAVPHQPGAPLSSLDNQRAVDVAARDVTPGAQSIDSNNFNLHDRLESIVDGNDNELLVARVPQVSQHHDLELEDDSALTRRTPQIPNINNAPAPFLACTMCQNAVTACEKTCKGNSACAIYCRCQAKATNIACEVCVEFFEDCHWEGQDHWVEVTHG